ncbi:NAD(P)-dependent glycerol-1-phosphate dehydrogenase [Thermogymnomonas acidicola]|uniref:NAD(P)-dependent glycerol-1-phosphate dehydrogenase n=1 Tax=Thermogymnomonas acidicola TaxID=399579 RepID=UPI001396B9BE|nr:NAD(P)-dependent glycerol-1-phosphate dehydrogenase [Thermogymnomonas acidicola]
MQNNALSQGRVRRARRHRECGSVVSRNLRSGSVAVITGNTTYSMAGRTVAELIESSGFDVHVHITGEANTENLNMAEEFCREVGAGMVIGVGGGTKIDLAKKAAYELDLPFVSVPTSPSHDGIASPRASIKRSGCNLSEEAAMPVAIIADTSIMVKAPYRYLAAGAADVISNETAILDWKLANRLHGEDFSTSAAALSQYAARELIEKAHLIMPGVEESVWLVMKQILASGTAMAIASSSRPASGSEHLIAHSLEMLGAGNSIHGEQCAIGSVVSMYLHGGRWEELAETYRKIRLSIRAKDYNISDITMIKALSTAHRIRPERYTILGERDLSYSAAERALEITGII